MKSAELEVLFERIELKHRINIKHNIINQIRDFVNSKYYYFKWLYATLWHYLMGQIDRNGGVWLITDILP
jgi:hypothetical protein